MCIRHSTLCLAHKNGPRIQGIIVISNTCILGSVSLENGATGRVPTVLRTVSHELVWPWSLSELGSSPDLAIYWLCDSELLLHL